MMQPIDGSPFTVPVMAQAGEVPDIEICVCENGFLIRHHTTERAADQLTLPGRQAAADISGVSVDDIAHLSPSFEVIKTYVATTWDEAKEIVDDLMKDALISDDGPDDDPKGPTLIQPGSS